MEEWHGIHHELDGSAAGNEFMDRLSNAWMDE
jgi:hypothetical protein